MDRRFVACLLSLCFLSLPVHAGESADAPHRLLGTFDKGWEKNWKHKRLYRPRTQYEAVQLEGETVLLAKSKRTASIYYRPLDVRDPQQARVSWRWRVERSLTENTRETEKKGDDYAARVFVVFDPGVVGKNIRSLCYVWAGNEPVGSVYPSPYAKSVQTVVLESGDERAGEWVMEERDVVGDFEKLFGESPPAITAVAVMVDTDNTRSEVQSWFDDIVLTLGTGESEMSIIE